MPDVDQAALLREIPLFEALSSDDLGVLAARLVLRSYRAGEVIFKQGDAGNEMYIVADGQVNIFLPGEASRRISLKDLGRGEYFGELGLFDDKPRSASALATTDAVLLGLTRPMLASYLEHRPQATMPMLRTMAERLRQTNALLSQRAAKNVVEELERNLSWGDRLADKVASLNGSWAFILGLLVLIAAWIVINAPGVLGSPFDVYPYVFFNLVLAILVVLQGPLIVMSQNRDSHKDRAQAEADFNVNLKNEVNIETILRELGEFRAETAVRLGALESRDGRSDGEAWREQSPEMSPQQEARERARPA
jgi:CRP/FNR family transcriptional regulator, cyclic AMP receptor protein